MFYYSGSKCKMFSPLSRSLSTPIIERTHSRSKRQARRLRELAPYPINCSRRLDFSNLPVEEVEGLDQLDELNRRIEIVISLS